MTTNPSFFSWTAYFVAARCADAFVMPYAAILALPVPFTNFMSPAGEPITITFFKGAVEARSSGRKAEMLWMTPSVLILNYDRELAQLGRDGYWTYCVDEVRV